MFDDEKKAITFHESSFDEICDDRLQEIAEFYHAFKEKKEFDVGYLEPLFFKSSFLKEVIAHYQTKIPKSLQIKATNNFLAQISADDKDIAINFKLAGQGISMLYKDDCLTFRNAQSGESFVFNSGSKINAFVDKKVIEWLTAYIENVLAIFKKQKYLDKNVLQQEKFRALEVARKQDAEDWQRRIEVYNHFHGSQTQQAQVRVPPDIKQLVNFEDGDEMLVDAEELGQIQLVVAEDIGSKSEAAASLIASSEEALQKMREARLRAVSGSGEQISKRPSQQENTEGKRIKTEDGYNFSHLETLHNKVNLIIQSYYESSQSEDVENGIIKDSSIDDLWLEIFRIMSLDESIAEKMADFYKIETIESDQEKSYKITDEEEETSFIVSANLPSNYKVGDVDAARAFASSMVEILNHKDDIKENDSDLESENDLSDEDDQPLAPTTPEPEQNSDPNKFTVKSAINCIINLCELFADKSQISGVRLDDMKYMDFWIEKDESLEDGFYRVKDKEGDDFSINFTATKDNSFFGTIFYKKRGKQDFYYFAEDVDEVLDANFKLYIDAIVNRAQQILQVQGSAQAQAAAVLTASHDEEIDYRQREEEGARRASAFAPTSPSQAAQPLDFGSLDGERVEEEEQIFTF